MLIGGRWHLGNDGTLRPVIYGKVLAGDGSWKPARFLVDTGADRTVFSEDVLQGLGLATSDDPNRLVGVGGRADSVLVDTKIQFTREDGSKVLFRGQFAAFTDPAALDMSVLGRDILNLFAVIVDRPGDVVCLVGHGHSYAVQSP